MTARPTILGRREARIINPITRVWYVSNESKVTPIVHTRDFEIAQNPDPAQLETNPYGLAVGPDRRLWMTDAAGAVSLGTADATGPSGSVIRVGRGSTSETVLSELSFPTAIAFDVEGKAYVTVNGVGAPGSGQVVRYAGMARAGR